MAKEYWVKCKIGPGMFSCERLIIITDAWGREHQGWAHEGCVDEKNSIVKVVYIISSDEKYILIQCNPAWEMLTHTLMVAKDQIVEKEE